jgi:hypothetical protein
VDTNTQSGSDRLTSFVELLLNNKAKFLRVAIVLQFLLGLFLLSMSYFMGKTHFDLIRKGLRTPGTIVDYKQEYFRRTGESFGSSGYMPIVEYSVGDRIVRFTDWLGSSSAGFKNQRVTVLYNPTDLTVAIIDRPIWNWLPWASIGAVGLFMLFVAIKGFVRNRPEQSACGRND